MAKRKNDTENTSVVQNDAITEVEDASLASEQANDVSETIQTEFADNSSAQDDFVIEMRHITKEFPGIIANDDITLQLKRGEIHALLGENGAGKSTLMSVLFGLYQPEKGEILKDGKVVKINSPNDATALGIGMVHQHFKLVEVFSVLDNIILGAEDKLNELEYELFSQVREEISRNASRILNTAKALAQIDVLASLSTVAVMNNYVRPAINEKGLINIKDGRHPVVEKMINNDMFISNDTLLDNGNNRISIITGPNMAGKSTYMRQTALIVLMAQIGSFVPASYADIGIVDRIFTRVGASDDLASGQSTFMVEMTEVANILRNATPDSLLILDEIGRGTSTFDGLSIAWAVVEHIANTKILGSKTLFATHYHELTELEGTLDGVNNYCIAVKEKGDDIVFLRKIVRGGADKSYGIQVARLAGVPETVITRAKELVTQLSDADISQKAKLSVNFV